MPAPVGASGPQSARRIPPPLCRTNDAARVLTGAPTGRGTGSGTSSIRYLPTEHGGSDVRILGRPGQPNPR
jgi:hypothetical protein